MTLVGSAIPVLLVRLIGALLDDDALAQLEADVIVLGAVLW